MPGPSARRADYPQGVAVILTDRGNGSVPSARRIGDHRGLGAV